MDVYKLINKINKYKIYDKNNYLSFVSLIKNIVPKFIYNNNILIRLWKWLIPTEMSVSLLKAYVLLYDWAPSVAKEYFLLLSSHALQQKINNLTNYFNQFTQYVSAKIPHSIKYIYVNIKEVLGFIVSSSLHFLASKTLRRISAICSIFVLTGHSILAVSFFTIAAIAGTAKQIHTIRSLVKLQKSVDRLELIFNLAASKKCISNKLILASDDEIIEWKNNLAKKLNKEMIWVNGFIDTLKDYGIEDIAELMVSYCYAQLPHPWSLDSALYFLGYNLGFATNDSNYLVRKILIEKKDFLESQLSENIRGNSKEIKNLLEELKNSIPQFDYDRKENKQKSLAAMPIARRVFKQDLPYFNRSIHEALSNLPLKLGESAKFLVRTIIGNRKSSKLIGSSLKYGIKVTLGDNMLASILSGKQTNFHIKEQDIIRLYSSQKDSYTKKLALERNESNIFSDTQHIVSSKTI